MFGRYRDGPLKCLKCGVETHLSLQDVQPHEQVCCFGCSLPLVQKEPESRDWFVVINEVEMVKEEENNDANKGH